jgi:hypothetical protein
LAIKMLNNKAYDDVDADGTWAERACLHVAPEGKFMIKPETMVMMDMKHQRLSCKWP